jgi:thiol-disulfide isomerase/thioredoxin
VLVDFWTYSCINCLRTLPYVRAWADKYRDAGLVVIGVHAPEFDFEHRTADVSRAAERLHLDFPIAQDNDFAIWRAFGNQAWPAFYFVDAQGPRARATTSARAATRSRSRQIRRLLAEAGAHRAPDRQRVAAGLGHRSRVEHAAQGVARDLSGLRARERRRDTGGPRSRSPARLSTASPRWAPTSGR